MNTTATAARDLTAGARIVLNGEVVTVTDTARTIDGKFGDVAVTVTDGARVATFYARPTAGIPTIPAQAG